MVLRHAVCIVKREDPLSLEGKKESFSPKQALYKFYQM